MTRQNLEIKDFEDKKTQAGARYTRFQTNKGYMSCFDKEQSEQLKKFEGKTASVEIQESGKFKNIKKVYGEQDNQTEEDEQVEVVKVSNGNDGVSTDRVDRAKAMELAFNLPHENLDQLKTNANELFIYITKGK